MWLQHPRLPVCKIAGKSSREGWGIRGAGSQSCKTSMMWHRASVLPQAATSSIRHCCSWWQSTPSYLQAAQYSCSHSSCHQGPHPEKHLCAPVGLSLVTWTERWIANMFACVATHTKHGHVNCRKVKNMTAYGLLTQGHPVSSWMRLCCLTLKPAWHPISSLPVHWCCHCLNVYALQPSVCVQSGYYYMVLHNWHRRVFSLEKIHWFRIFTELLFSNITYT